MTFSRNTPCDAYLMSLMNLGMRLDSQSRITIELLDAEDDLVPPPPPRDEVCLY
jgi:hypothetical protein